MKSYEEFEQFVKSISEVLDSKTIHRESKERIKSAIRFYRMGRDSEQFENKYLNWWTALEYLLRSNEGKIIEQIEDKLKTILVLNYTAKHLCSFRNTFLSCGLRPSPKICQQFSIESYELLPLYDIFAAIHNADEMAHINGRLSSYPAVKFHLDRFVSQTRNPNDLLNTLSNHEDHVRWQIHRIWRLRCDIVHSAEYSVNLVLLSANIEYYLKYLLSEMLGKLCNNRAIESLAELFDRMSYSYDRLKSDLKNGKMDFHSEILRTGLI